MFLRSDSSTATPKTTAAHSTTRTEATNGKQAPQERATPTKTPKNLPRSTTTTTANKSSKNEQNRSQEAEPSPKDAQRQPQTSNFLPISRIQASSRSWSTASSKTEPGADGGLREATAAPYSSALPPNSPKLAHFIISSPYGQRTKNCSKSGNRRQGGQAGSSWGELSATTTSTKRFYQKF